MNDDQNKKLNKLNYDFYESISKYWNNSPDYEWDGWVYLEKYFQEIYDNRGKIRVLDLGCGNGRFYNYLQKRFGKDSISYIGVDFSDYLLSLARDNFEKQGAVFIKEDLFFGDWSFVDSDFDAVVSFGLIHHIPDEKLRLDFFSKFIEFFNDENVIGIITTWNYKEIPRISKKMIDRESSNLGENDNILYWDKYEYGERFSHYYTKNEMDLYLKDMKLLEFYKDDDKKQVRNSYYVFKRK